MGKWQFKKYCPDCNYLVGYEDYDFKPYCCPECGSLGNLRAWPRDAFKRVRTGWFKWEWKRREEKGARDGAE